MALVNDRLRDGSNRGWLRAPWLRRDVWPRGLIDGQCPCRPRSDTVSPSRHYKCRLDLLPLPCSLSNRCHREWLRTRKKNCPLTGFQSGFEPVHWPMLPWKTEFVAPHRLTMRVKSSFSGVPWSRWMRNDRDD